MTANKRFKRLVRARAAKTGESYTAALRRFRAKPGDEPMLSCSFCGKPQTEVKKIIAGPGVYICNVCVELCDDIIAQVEQQPDAAPRTSSGPAPERVLQSLPSRANTLRSLEADIAGKVGFLRRQGIGWDRIAGALGMDEPEAVAKYAGQ